MSDRVCIRGCTIRGLHYATCPDFGRSDGDCEGCAPVEARDGVLLCDRCYGRLRSKLETVPDLVGHLRSIADPLKAMQYDRVMVQGSGSDAAPAPVSADLIDAADDILHAIGAGSLEPGASSESAYRRAYFTIAYLLESFDTIANDRDAALEWWRLVMSAELPENPEYWTITRVLSRWPLEDRRTWAKQPCPECGLRSVKITPPRHRYARTWFACQSCGWKKTEKDDDGLWAAAFGQHVREGRRYEGSTNMDKTKTPQPKPSLIEVHDIDLGDAIKAGISYVLENTEAVEKVGTFGVPTAAIIGATPVLAEQFCDIAESIAKTARANYANGDLLAGGARLVAAAIRAAVRGDGGAVLDALAAELAAMPELTGDESTPEPTEAAA
jgi:predicted RNA-binding Zn-ribbon protein involved in translation (DUF1610 family)